MQSVGNRVGVIEPFLMRMAHGAPVRTASRSRNAIKGLHSRLDFQLGVSKCNTLSDEQSLRVCRRFYVALILSRLVQVISLIIHFHHLLLRCLLSFYCSWTSYSNSYLCYCVILFLLPAFW